MSVVSPDAIDRRDDYHDKEPEGIDFLGRLRQGFSHCNDASVLNLVVAPPGAGSGDDGFYANDEDRVQLFVSHLRVI
jgi:hypothetical protein